MGGLLPASTGLVAATPAVTIKVGIMNEEKKPAERWVKIVLAILAFGGIGLLIRRLYTHQPCPSSLSFLLENPYMNRIAGPELLLDRAGVEPGMHVLDVGCGSGRIALPAAQRVGSEGVVVALDIQEAMLGRVREKMREQNVTNVHLLHAGAGQGCTVPGSFDRAFLVTVLGEVPDKVAALQEIHRALKPGGILSITELFPDPDLQTPGTIRKLARETGFQVGGKIGSFPAFTMNLVKPT
jgi:SAM-dependent methyltransferase